MLINWHLDKTEIELNTSTGIYHKHVTSMKTSCALVHIFIIANLGNMQKGGGIQAYQKEPGK